MKKTVKKIIHVSCLIFLLFICNRIISSNGTTVPSKPSLSMAFSIEEASVKLDDLMEQRKKGEKIDSETRLQISNTLMAYSGELKIWVFDKNDNPIGICDTKGWKEDEATKKTSRDSQTKTRFIIYTKFEIG